MECSHPNLDQVSFDTRSAEKVGYKRYKVVRVQWPEERARKTLGLPSCPLLLSQWHTKDNWVPAGSQIHRRQVCLGENASLVFMLNSESCNNRSDMPLSTKRQMILIFLLMIDVGRYFFFWVGCCVQLRHPLMPHLLFPRRRVIVVWVKPEILFGTGHVGWTTSPLSLCDTTGCVRALKGIKATPR